MGGQAVIRLHSFKVSFFSRINVAMFMCRALRYGQQVSTSVVRQSLRVSSVRCLSQVHLASSSRLQVPGSSSGVHHSAVLTTQLPLRRSYATAITAADVEARVLAVCEAFDVITKPVTLTTHFQNELGLDSLDMVELVMKVEDEFGFEIPDQDAEKFLTPADMVKYVCEKEEI